MQLFMNENRYIEYNQREKNVHTREYVVIILHVFISNVHPVDICEALQTHLQLVNIISDMTLQVKIV